MQLIDCPVEPCGKGEIWNSTAEVATHMVEYHPQVKRWDWVDKDHDSIVVTEDDGFVTEEEFREADQAPVEPYVFADWAASYSAGSFEEAFADIFQETFDLLVARQHKVRAQEHRAAGRVRCLHPPAR